MSQCEAQNFANTSAYIRGGGLYFLVSAVITMREVMLTSCRAYNAGGGESVRAPFVLASLPPAVTCMWT